jgi:hypothetical protein
VLRIWIGINAELGLDQDTAVYVNADPDLFPDPGLAITATVKKLHFFFPFLKFQPFLSCYPIESEVIKHSYLGTKKFSKRSLGSKSV